MPKAAAGGEENSDRDQNRDERSFMDLLERLGETQSHIEASRGGAGLAPRNVVGQDLVPTSFRKCLRTPVMSWGECSERSTKLPPLSNAWHSFSTRALEPLMR